MTQDLMRDFCCSGWLLVNLKNIMVKNYGQKFHLRAYYHNVPLGQQQQISTLYGVGDDQR